MARLARAALAPGACGLLALPGDGFAIVGFFGRAGPWEPERGGLAIYDIASGELTKTHPIPDEDFAEGHTGAGIWATPAIDTDSGFLYVGTSNPHNPHLEHERSNSLLRSTCAARARPSARSSPPTRASTTRSSPARRTSRSARPRTTSTTTAASASPAWRSTSTSAPHPTSTACEVARVPVGTPCFACNAASSAFVDGTAFVAAGPPGQLVKRRLQDDTGTSMFQATTSSGIAIARNTLYTAASSYVIAYRPAS